jgi:hypothetical protein
VQKATRARYLASIVEAESEAACARVGAALRAYHIAHPRDADVRDLAEVLALRWAALVAGARAARAGSAG